MTDRSLWHASTALLLLSPLCATSVAFAAEQTPEQIYQERCASCHDKPADRTPSRAQMGSMSPMFIVGALMTGKMQTQASGLSPADVTALATLLGARAPAGQSAAVPPPPSCGKVEFAMSLDAPHWNGWSADVENTRFQRTAKLAAADVPRLKLKWAYGYSGSMAYGQPTYVSGQVIVTNTNGDVVALSADSGCMYWQHRAPAGVKSAVSVAQVGKGSAARFVVLFGDEKANAHAIDARTGEPLWTVKLDEHPYARVTGAPRYYDGRLFVPLSSIEEVPGRAPNYECCKFRGAVVALDVATGKVLWKGYTIADEPKPFKKSTAGT